MTAARSVGVLTGVAVAALIGRGVHAAPGDVPPAGAGSDIEMGGPPPAAPDEDAPLVKDPKVAKKWLAVAKELVGKGDAFAKRNKAADATAQYENAVTAYGKALEAGDDLGVYFQLAQVEDKLGKTDAAARHYRTVAGAKAGVPPALAKQAQAKFDDASAKIGLVTFTVSPDGTQIASGTERLGKTPLAEPLILSPGTYTLTLTSDGYRSKAVEIKVEAGSESDRKVDLEPMKIVIETPPPMGGTDEPVGPPPAKPSNVPMLVGAGVGGALLVISIVEDFTARSWHNTFVAPMTSKDERQFAHDAGRRDAHIADACLAGAIAATAFTAAWYVFVYRKGPAKPPAETQRIVPKVDMIPWVQPDAGGLSLAGSF